MRTCETAEIVFGELKCQPTISLLDELYHATVEQMIFTLNHVAEPAASLLIIGHNPGFEEFLSRVTEQEIRFPTAALAQLEFVMDSWSLFSERTRGKLVNIWRPREIDAN